MAARGGHGAAENRDGIEQVCSFLLANGMARFIPAWEDEGRTGPIVRDVAGYRARVGEGWDYYVTATAWKEEVCRGLDARRLAAVMVKLGHMEAPDRTAKSDRPDRFSKMVRVPGHGNLRLYHVLGSALEAMQ